MIDGMEKPLLPISGQVCLKEKEALKKYWRWLLIYLILLILIGKVGTLKILKGSKSFGPPTWTIRASSSKTLKISTVN